MPFSSPQGATFQDFEDCVDSMSDEDGIDDPEALCAVWMRQAKKLSDEYDVQALLEAKEELDLNSMEFLEALKLLEEYDAPTSKAEIPDKYEEPLGKDRFVPPETAQENAQQALDWREEHPEEIDGGTEVGWRRANQIVSGETLTPETVDRMASFRRHEDNASVDEEHEGEPWMDAGRVAWLLWGGEAGVSWAESLADRMDDIDAESS